MDQQRVNVNGEPLRVAVLVKNPVIVKMLLEAGANPSQDLLLLIFNQYVQCHSSDEIEDQIKIAALILEKNPLLNIDSESHMENMKDEFIQKVKNVNLESISTIVIPTSPHTLKNGIGFISVPGNF